MDAYETTRRIRQNPRHKLLPILALTARAMKGDREKCLEAGASDYIAKPVNSDQLIGLLGIWLFAKNSRDEEVAMTQSTANILVVDDDDKSLLAMEALLAGPGRNIVKARSGTEALRELMRREFAVILLDVRMPDMDGFETAEMIRQRERLRHVPIIFLSAVDTLESDV